MARPKLVIIPGVGDRSRWYTVFALIWRCLGYEVYVIPFGWAYYDAGVVVQNKHFIEQLKNLEATDIKLIGVSAGGTTAVQMYAHLPQVTRVITVCTPYEEFPHMQNYLLRDSIRAMNHDLEKMTLNAKRNILSVHAVYDQVVPARMSRPKDIKTLRIWSVYHAPTIFVALVFCCLRLNRFLRTPGNYSYLNGQPA